MSLQAFQWAGQQDCARPVDKLVLLAMADRHNRAHDGLYPSVAWLCEYTGLDRKTVLLAVARLREAELIIDTGKRVGRGVIVYRLGCDRSGPKNGTGSSTENGTANEDDETGKRSRFSAQPVPKTGPVPVPKTGHRTSKGNREGTEEGGGVRPRTRERTHTRDAHARAATQIPPDFQPVLTDAAQAIVAAWPAGMLERELSQFKNRCTAKGETYKDWQAAFRTWIGNAQKWRIERNERPNASIRGARPDPAVDLWNAAQRQTREAGDSGADSGARLSLPSGERDGP